MAMPGSKQQTEIKQKPNSNDKNAVQVEDSRVEELDFNQMKDQGEELRLLREDHAREQLEKIKKLRLVENPKKKNKNGDIRIDLKDITTETESRKGGMPEHIAKLPENHSIRVRWEKGFRQREDGTWYKLSANDLPDHLYGLSEERQQAFMIVPLIAIGLAMIIGGNWYTEELTDTRKEIFKTVMQKELPKNNPETKKKLKRSRESRWLPELTSLLAEFKDSKSRFTSLSDNTEGGSYIKHITKHNIKFDPDEAMQWRARVIRKPSS